MRAAAAVAGRLKRASAVALLLLFGCLAFGISGSDEAALRAFDEATARWQSNPDFRSVAYEYCVIGSRAMRSRGLGVPAATLVMAARSIPHLPPEYAVNPTSQAHYGHFSRGPLAAYLFLCGEQSVQDYAPVIEGSTRRGEMTQQDRLAFLNAFHTAFAVCTDRGALQSVSSLVDDVQPLRPLTVRADVGPLLLPHIAAIANELGLPTDPAAMTPDQQLAVLTRLDAHVRRRDPELWRAKQLNDFCAGVWAQVFSPPYRYVLRPAMLGHPIGVAGLLMMLLWWAIRRRSAPAGNPLPAATANADR